MCKTSLENKNKIEIDKERKRERGGKLPKVWEHKMGRVGSEGASFWLRETSKKGKGMKIEASI